MTTNLKIINPINDCSFKDSKINNDEKFITIKVNKCSTFNEAKNIAMSVGNSLLVKTALFAQDPNWGRILMAIGKSNSSININKIDLKLGNQLIFKHGNISKRKKKISG